MIDVAQELEVTRSFNVMGTQRVVEIADGKIVGHHVGAAPAEVLARFT